MIVINIKDGYNIRMNVKYNFVTDEKLWLFSWINKPCLFNTVVPNPELFLKKCLITKNIIRVCIKLFLLENGEKRAKKNILTKRIEEIYHYYY